MRRRVRRRTGADGAGGGDVRKLALDVRGRLPAGRPGVVAVIGVAATASPPSSSRSTTRPARCGLSRRTTLVRAAAGALGGSGGGKDDVAQGGGTDVSQRRRGARRGRARGRPRATSGADADSCGPACGSGSTSATPGSASPAATRRGLLADPGRDGAPRQGDLARLAALVAEEEARRGGVGLPRSLSGGEGRPRPRSGRSPAGWPRRVAPVPVRLVDERLSTVAAEAVLRERGQEGHRSDAPSSTRPLPSSSCRMRWTPNGRPGDAPGEVVPATRRAATPERASRTDQTTARTSITDGYDQQVSDLGLDLGRERRHRHRRGFGCLAVLLVLAVLVGGGLLAYSFGLQRAQGAS